MYTYTHTFIYSSFCFAKFYPFKNRVEGSRGQYNSPLTVNPLKGTCKKGKYSKG